MENELLIQGYKDVQVVSFQNVSVLDSANIDALQRQLLDLVVNQDKRKMILDFSAVRFMSSQALGMLLQLQNAMNQVKGKVLIVGIKPDLQKVFKITNLHKMFKFFTGLDEALGEFGVYIPKS